MRYTGWRRLSGDTAERPDLLDFGKKLLGYLEGQRRLSGVKTCVIERTLPDGSIVRARFDYEIPSIEVIAAGQPATPGTDTFLSGLVAQPRTFANYTAFGDKAETILVPFNVGTDQEKWASYFYDASYVPPEGGGIYSKTPQGKPLFADGLTLGGNLDWRSQDENISVNWFGPASRYFPENGQFGNWVFRNGDILFDVQNLPQFDSNIRTLVLSAAIRKPGTLLVCTYEKVFAGGGNHHYIRFYRAALHASSTADLWFKATGRPVYQAPRMELVDTAGMLLLDDPDLADDTPVVRIAQIEIPELTSYLYVVPFHFNQSATEARAILPLWQASPVATTVTEFVVDLRDMDAALVSQINHGTIAETETTTTTYGDVLLNVDEYPFFHWTDPTDLTSPDGTYPCPEPIASVEPDIPYYRPSGLSLTDTCEIPLNTVVTKATTNDQLEYPIAVDYQDDVPVYAYMKARDISATTTRNSTATHTHSESATGSVTVTGFGTLGVTRSFTYDSNASDESAADVTETYAASGVMPGLRCPRRLGGGNWLDVQGSTSASGGLTASSSLSATGSRSGTEVGTAGASAPVFQAWPSLDGTSSFSSEWTWADTTTTVSVWFLDLRYEAAIYTLATQAQTAHQTAALDVSVSTGAAIGVKFFNVAVGVDGIPTTTPITLEVTRARSYDTRVVFNGAQVDAWTGSSTTTDTTTTPSTSAILFGRSNSQTFGWRALSTFSPNYPHSLVQIHTADQPANTASTFLDAWDGTGPFPVHADDYPSDTNAVRWAADDGFLIDVGGDMGAAGVAGIDWPCDDGSGIYPGRHQAYRKGWCYSVPKLAGTVTATPLYGVAISSGESVDTLTGSHGLEMLGALWPLSRCSFLSSKG